jgi:hypothetical protein
MSNKLKTAVKLLTKHECLSARADREYFAKLHSRLMAEGDATSWEATKALDNKIRRYK